MNLSDRLDILAPIDSGTLLVDLVMSASSEFGSGASVVFNGDLKIGFFGVVIETIALPFTRGQAIQWDARISAGAGDYAPSDPFTGATSASARFGIQKLALTDDQGSPVSGWFYSSSSGWQYNADGGQMVPEPATVLMTGLGLWVMHRRRVPLARR
jgi:hypothetical protein